MHANLIVFGLIRPKIEAKIYMYTTRGEYVNS